MKRRQAFTLVELMVSMALIIFMMAILSQAFVAGLNTFRNLKAQGDLAEKLRSTSQILQHDLAANHFEGSRRLSDPTFWNNGPPQQGFFQLWQASAGIPESVLGDSFGINSYRSTNHALSFAVRLAGNDIGDFMSASALGSGNVWNPPPPLPYGSPVVPQLPGNPPPNSPTNPQNGLGIGAIGINPLPGPFGTPPSTFGPPESRYQPLLGVPGVTGYNSQWAAVAWFLWPQMNPATNLQDTTVSDPTAGTPAVPLYQLYRRQCLLVPDNNLVTLATIPQGSFGVPTSALGPPFGPFPCFLEMSCLPDPNKLSAIINFNSPRDITMPANRGTTATSLLPPPAPQIYSGWGGQTSASPNTAYRPISADYPTSLLAGSDIQLNDVVSFDVRVLPLYPLGYPQSLVDPFVTLFDPFFTTIFPNPTPPIRGATYNVFDTWSSVSNGINNYSNWNAPGAFGTSIPYWTTKSVTYQYPVGTLRTITLPGNTTMFQGMGTSASTQAAGSGPIIRAIQITIRIWDFKTNQTRQVTIVQAM